MMLYMTSGDIKEGRMKEFQAWVMKNQDLYIKHAPKGWTYRGTYAYVLGFGRYTVASLWECSKYGDFDTWREHRDETWTRLAEEADSFFAEGAGEAVLLREMGDVRIMEKAKLEEKSSRKS